MQMFILFTKDVVFANETIARRKVEMRPHSSLKPDYL